MTNQRKQGLLTQVEGLVFTQIDVVGMAAAGTWYQYVPGEKNTGIAIQASGDVAVDMSLNSGDIFTIKAGTVLAMDAQLASTPLYFRHQSGSAQQLQIVRLL